MSGYRNGNSRSALRKALKRAKRSDLEKAVKSGKLSLYAAVCAAGKRTRPVSLELITVQRKRREFALHPGRASRDQEMWLGVGHNGSVFPTEETARRYWIENRDRLMPELAVNGKRPMAWWHWDGPKIGLSFPGLEEQGALLYEAHELEELEERELVAWWREQFDRSFGSAFSCSENGKVLKGAVARRAHWTWSGAPRTLIRQWLWDRLHAARRIRALEAGAQRPGQDAKNEKRPSANC